MSDACNIGTTERGMQGGESAAWFSGPIVGGMASLFRRFTGGAIICRISPAAKIEDTTCCMDLNVGTTSGVGMFVGWERCAEECNRAALSLCICNQHIMRKGRVVSLFCGHWRSSHRAACEHYLANHSLEIPAKRQLVITSCGGSPYDINLIQAHKALDMASYACTDGGSIILLAECRDGFGRADFLKCLMKRIRCAGAESAYRYEVKGQTHGL